MIRIIRVPFRFVTFPVRLAAATGRAGWYAGRAVGLSRSVFFGLGFTTGVLVASPKARRVALAGARRATVAMAKSHREPPATAPVAASGAAPVAADSAPDRSAATAVAVEQDESALDGSVAAVVVVVEEDASALEGGAPATDGAITTTAPGDAAADPGATVTEDDPGAPPTTE